MRSRIAVYEGYASPFGRSPQGGYGSPAPTSRYGGPSMGRRAYYVPPERGYGPLEEGKRRYPIVRRGYKVKRKVDTPAMKRAMKRFSKAAKSCSRRKRGTSFQACMKRKLKSKR